MENTCLLPREYYLAELAYIDESIRNLPDIRIGRRRQNSKYYQVIRYSDTDKAHQKEIRLERAPQNDIDIAIKRDYLSSKRKAILKSCDAAFKNFDTTSISKIKLLHHEHLLSAEFYKNASPQCLPFDSDKCYKHNGYFMHSRAEKIIAQVLDKMGLEYKYEVAIPNTDFTADFLIFLPGLNCCFILEFLGRTDDYSYIRKNSAKACEYLNSGFTLYRDYVFTAGKSNSIPTDHELVGLINLVVSNIIHDSIVIGN